MAVVAAYQQGKTAAPISERFGVTPSAVYKILAACGVPRRGTGRVDGVRKSAPQRQYNKATRVDLLGERESLPPGIVRYSCPKCGMRAEAIAGHSQCQEAA